MVPSWKSTAMAMTPKELAVHQRKDRWNLCMGLLADGSDDYVFLLRKLQEQRSMQKGVSARP